MLGGSRSPGDDAGLVLRAVLASNRKVIASWWPLDGGQPKVGGTQHAGTFFAEAEAAAGADLPQFFKDEFEAFLNCGILAHGFMRLRCSDCGHDKLVANSRKRRGFCPSCGARRMAQTAAHLVDHVIPHVPVRQWVLIWVMRSARTRTPRAATSM